jgi:tripartite-type tricarboxylate transporter receptor subunit TctC
MINRRMMIGAVAAFATSIALPAAAQDWPSREIELIVPSSPGGPTDALARSVAELLGKELGQQVLVKNVTGASGSIGMAQVARAKPDGYTLGFAWNSLVVSTLVRKEMPYDIIKDFTPIGVVAGNVNVMVVNASNPAKTLGELIENARTKEVVYGSFGLGTMTNLNAEMIAKMAGVQFKHVPYPGTAPAQLDLLGDRIAFIFNTVSAIKPLVDDGKLRALGTTGVERHPLIPDVPTIGETLPGYKFLGWFGIVGPADMPPDVVAKLSAAIGKVVDNEQYRKKLIADGFDEAKATPEEMKARMEQDLSTWGEVIKWANIEKQ